MAKKSVSKISNAFSTGGGGVHFENQIQAMFLLSLLIDGFCPAMNERTKRVCFQAKRLGFDVDDLVIYTFGNPIDKKLLCQIKHSITISSRNKTFQEVIASAWSDFKKEEFDKNNDQIAVVVAQISSSAQKSLRFLHAQAISAVDEIDFLNRVEQPLYSSADNKKAFDTIKECIVKTDAEPSDFELWQFCKAFILLLFDLDCEESVNRALSESLIRCNSSENSFTVWARLLEYACNCNQNAAIIDRNNINFAIKKFFISEKLSHIFVSPITEIDLFIPYIALIGSWREDNKNDRCLIEKISKIGYSEFEAKARDFLVKYPEYLQLSNNQWNVIPKEELLELCKNKIFNDMVNRLIEAGRELLSQKSRRVVSDRPYIIPLNGEYDHSYELRNSIINSLCWVKKVLQELPNCNLDQIKVALSQLVQDQLRDADWIAYASLGDNLRYLAELSPDIFMANVEKGIIEKPKDFLKLFPQKSDGLVGTTNYITELLWSLEVLAWSPEYLASSICILGRLEALSYEKTNWSNTPINSIVSILLPWDPQTTADIYKRKNALICLKNENGEIYWQVLKLLLPNQTTYNTENPRPKYLSLQITEDKRVTYAELQKEYDILLDLAVDTACTEAEKLSDLACSFEYMQEPVLSKYLDSIEKCIDANEKEEQIIVLWQRLQERLTDIKPTDRLLKLLEKLKPKDIRLKYRELYHRNVYQFDENDYLSNWERLESEKSTAVRMIYNQYGVEETEQFGLSVDNIDDVGRKLGSSLFIDELSGVINTCYLGLITKEFTISCIKSFVYKNGEEKLLETTLQYMDELFTLDILSKLDFSVRLLKVVNHLLNNESFYWEKAEMPYVLFKDATEESRTIIDNLIACRRYVTALNLIGRSKLETVISGKKIFRLLKLAGTEDSIGNEKIDNYAALRIIGWLHHQDFLDLKAKSDIDFLYLPLFNDHSDVQPIALHTMLGTDPGYFCSMIELSYSKRVAENHEIVLNSGMKDRLCRIFLRFKVTPGIDCDGNFNEQIFRFWIKSVKEWSSQNNVYEETMKLVGSGLAYAPLDSEKLPNTYIMEELNKVENDEMRLGYYSALAYPWGVRWIDPEGKPELNMAKDFYNRAEIAEEKGYSRYANTLKNISKHFTREAEKIIGEAKKPNTFPVQQ